MWPYYLMKFLKQFLLEFTSGREIEEKESKEQIPVLKLHALTKKQKQYKNNNNKNLSAWEVHSIKD